MGDRGLDASIWASRGDGSTKSLARPGDWNCPSCSFSNFQRRTECFQCSTSRVATPRSSSPAVTTLQQSFMAPHVENVSRLGGQYAAMKRPEIAVTMAQSQRQPPARLDLEKRLVDSYWAPRNYHGRVINVERPQLWVKKHSQDVSVANSQAAETNLTLLLTTSPDLGLPYEVQHFILSVIQRILEEGCYDFAYRWIPSALNDRNWSCAEAVELSTWRDLLPAALPPNALVPVAGYSLTLGLKDAIKIRNSAVHRHLCDNTEIRRMAHQAENLMKMFRDVTRQNKFQRLDLVLFDWDKGSGGDQQTARLKLEQALQEISERPMDDMDWTPNAVSLQEITLEVEQAPATGYGDFGDKMELD